MDKRRIAAALLAAAMLAGCGETADSEDDLMIRASVDHTAATSETSLPLMTETITKETTMSEKPTETTTESSTTATTKKTTTTTEATTTTVTTTTVPETTTPPPETTTLPPTETTTTTTTATAAPAKTEPAETKAPAPKEIKAASFMVATTLGSTSITWDAVDGADGYTVCVRRSKDGEWEELASTKKTSWSTDEFGRNKDYAFTVKAYTEKDGKRTYAKKNEISEFPYLTQKNGVTYVDGLLLVNKTYPLPQSYAPGGLTAETNAAFEEMRKGAAKDGVSLWVCSGYRSYAYQSTLYWNYVARDGSQASADRYSARPGHSEHQSGLCADLNWASRYFNGSPTAIWIQNNCWKYGFIIRYPEGKEDITGYNYESWHVRFVGKEMSKLLTESGLTLEEYYGLTSKYNY